MGNVLSNVILDVEDLDRSLSFYHDLLKLPIQRKESYQGHRLAYLDGGNAEITLLEQPKHEQNPLFDRRGGLVMKFYVLGLRGLSTLMHGRHFRVLQELEVPAVGESTFLVEDPDGYAVLLAERMETLN